MNAYQIFKPLTGIAHFRFMSQPSAEKMDSPLAWNIAVAGLSRLALNTARRFPYPFAPVLSRSMDVPLTAVTSLIAVNQATGILGLFFGPLADHFGYRVIMLTGLTILAGGMFAGGFLPYYAVVLTALFLAGLGKSIFDPAMQAYIGQRVPYHRRGLVIGIIEFSWAGSALAGIPLIGLLIDSCGWRAPFFFLGGLALLSFIGVALLIPGDGRLKSQHGVGVLFWKPWQLLGVEKPALGVIGFVFLLSMANDNLFVVYGAWLESSFQLSTVALGMGTAVIGAAELLGEILAASLGDRIGLKRSIILGLILSVLSYAGLPLLGKNLSLAMTGLFLIFITLEFTIVTALSLATELLPGSRATMMSGFHAAAGSGRIFGALMGGPIWLAGKIEATGVTSALITALALALLIWSLKSWRAAPPTVD